MAVHGDTPAFGQVTGAHLRLRIPGRDADEVCAFVGTVDREQEARHLAVPVDVAEVDVAGEIPDQGHHVHGHASSSLSCQKT